MSDPRLDNTLADHRLAYGIDCVQLHWSWASQWLYAGDRRQAYEACQRARKAAEGVIRQFDQIGDTLRQADVIGQEAAEWRADRDRKLGRSAA